MPVLTSWREPVERVALVAVAAAALAGVTTPARGADPNFAERPLIADESLALFDFDLDGDLDIIGHSSALGASAWFENDGASPPSFQPHAIVAPAPSGQMMAVGTISADQYPDVLIVRRGEDYNDHIDLALSSAQPPLQFTILQDVLSVPSGIIITPPILVDVDADDDLDVVVVGLTAAWHENLGGNPPTFAMHDLSSLVQDLLTACAVADVNADGHMDILLGGLNTWWLRNDGEQNFTAENLVTSFYVTDIDVADADLDGDLDLITSTYTLAGNGALSWLENIGGAEQPQFVERRLVSAFNFGLSAARFADLNDDGLPDILTDRYFGNDLAWFENTPSDPNRFMPRLVVGLSPVSNPLAADLDADGDIDVVSSGRWLENGEIINSRTQTRYTDLQPAVADALPGDTLLAAPGALFAESLLDLSPKPLSIQATGRVRLSPDSLLTLGHSTSLSAPGGESMVLGPTLLPTDVAATLGADTVEFATGGSLTLAPGATLLVNAPMTTVSTNEMDLDSTAHLHCTGDLTFLAASSFEALPIAPFTGVDYYDGADGQILTADLNSDAMPDLLIRDYDDVYWFQNAGPGLPPIGPLEIESDQFSSLHGVSCMATADLDLDGDLDLFLVKDDAIAWLERLPGATPAFTYHLSSSPLPSSPFDTIWSISMGDIDADGFIDAVVSGSSTGALWCRNTGAGPDRFTGQTITPDAEAIAIADLDRNGRPDVLATPCDGSVSAWERGANGLFTERTIIDEHAACSPLGAAVADVDLDGDLDLFYGTGLAWYENPGAGGTLFTRHEILPWTEYGPWIAPADLDSDGDPDLVVATYDLDYSLTAWFENRRETGVVSFVEHTIAPSDVTGPVAALDYDGDNAIDIVGVPAIGQTAELTLFLNTFANPADLADSTVTAASIDLDRRALLASGATLDAPAGIVVGPFSAFTGGAAISGPLTLQGRATIPTGLQLLIGEAFDQASGRLTVELPQQQQGQPTPVEALGPGSLSGTLLATAQPGFDPPVGATFEVLSAASLTGRFDVAFLPALPDRYLTILYQSGARGEHTADRAGSSVLLQVNALDDNVEFDPAPSAGADGTPTDATLADMNDDGFLDLVMLVPDPNSPNQTPGSILIFYNDTNAGDGSWQGFANVTVVQQIFNDVGIQPSALAIGDLNDDDVPDLVIANRGVPGNSAPDSITVLINEPGASGAVPGVSNPFGVDQSFVIPVGDEPRDIALVDLDDDELLDIAVIHAGLNDSLLILWNAGSQTPARSSERGRRSRTWLGTDPDTDELDLPDTEPTSIRPGDFDAGTIFPALVLTSSTNDTVMVIANNGARDLALHSALHVDRIPIQLIVTDLNLDTLPDIVTVNQIGNSVSILLNDAPAGGIAFRPSVELPISDAPSFPRSIAAGDFDDDGDPDLGVVANGDTDAGQPTRIIKILRNDLSDPNGQLIFTQAADQIAGEAPLIVLAGDVNNDARDDLLGVNASNPSTLRAENPTDQVSVRLSSNPPCRGDIDGDRDTDVFDFAEFLAHFAQSVPPLTHGDLDGDAVVTVWDFAILASNWGCTP